MTLREMIKIFEGANKRLISKDKSLFDAKVAERSICGALASCLREELNSDKKYLDYYVDVEYNRNAGEIKTIIDDELRVVKITCDLIVHSRGQNKQQDNLIAIEMKKSTAKKMDKRKDKDRLIALTKDTFSETWSYDGVTLPEHVCRYVLGVYYEINYSQRLILLEYYQKGKMVAERLIVF